MEGQYYLTDCCGTSFLLPSGLYYRADIVNCQYENRVKSRKEGIFR